MTTTTIPQLRILPLEELYYQRQHISFSRLLEEIGKVTQLIVYHWSPILLSEGKIHDHLTGRLDFIKLRSPHDGKNAPRDEWGPTRDYLVNPIEVFDRPRPDQADRFPHLYKFELSVDGFATYDDWVLMQRSVTHLNALRLGSVPAYGMYIPHPAQLILPQPLMAIEHINYVGSIFENYVEASNTDAG